MDGPNPFGTPPSYHMTLSCDLGLIHRARRGFVYQDFVTCENGGVLPFGFLGAETPKLIHAKPIRGFVYRDFATCENEGSFPLVSRVPKCRNLFMLNRFGVSYTGISQLVKMRGLSLWFPMCRNAETYSR
jgi:hypothetical protein